MTEERSDWGFSDADDARSYLSEVMRLWSAWIAGLVGLMLARGVVLAVIAVVTITALLWLARPIQARAVRLVPVDTLVGSRWTVVGKGTQRDRVLRALAYGEAPVRAAVAMGSGSPWVTAYRRGVVVATIVGFAAVAWSWLVGGWFV
jgi:hypothetical protein